MRYINQSRNRNIKTQTAILNEFVLPWNEKERYDHLKYPISFAHIVEEVTMVGVLLPNRPIIENFHGTQGKKSRNTVMKKKDS